MEDLRIVRGNDFYLKVPVSRVVFDKTLGGEATKGDKPMHLDDCSDVRVNLISDVDESRPLEFVIAPLHDELNYDISANHSDAEYNDLSEALGSNGANVPAANRQSKMSVTFKRKRYVVACSYTTTQPTGDNVHSLGTNPNIADGVYFNDEIAAFTTLPSDANTIKTYYWHDEDASKYLVWAVTLKSDTDGDSSTYLYYYTKTSVDNRTFANTSNWRSE